MEVKEQAIKNLEDFKKVCDSLDIRFMLMEGTLLGAYREKDFILNDEKDIDLGIHDKYFKKFDLLIEELNKIGFKFPKKCIIDGELHGGAFHRGPNHIDIMRMIKHGDDTIINYGLKGKLMYVYDADIYEEYGKIDFHGTIYEAPGKIEKFLEQRYGDWKTPISTTKYSWKPSKHSPNAEWTIKRKVLIKGE